MTTGKGVASKKVEFCEEPTMTLLVNNGEECEELWYSRVELTAQLEESKRVVSDWIAQGYAVLVANSYLTPHINVQDYLNAFCSDESMFTMRGLESSLDGSLKEERSQTRQAHVKIVLEAARASQNNAQSVCQVSRQSSAPSKLYAMRMGRADARWMQNQHGDDATELVQEHLKRQSSKRRSSKDSVSTASTGALSSMDSSLHGTDVTPITITTTLPAGPVPALVSAPTHT